MDVGESSIMKSRADIILYDSFLDLKLSSIEDDERSGSAEQSEGCLSGVEAELYICFANF